MKLKTVEEFFEEMKKETKKYRVLEDCDFGSETPDGQLLLVCAQRVFDLQQARAQIEETENADIGTA